MVCKYWRCCLAIQWYWFAIRFLHTNEDWSALHRHQRAPTRRPRAALKRRGRSLTISQPHSFSFPQSLSFRNKSSSCSKQILLPNLAMSHKKEKFKYITVYAVMRQSAIRKSISRYLLTFNLHCFEASLIIEWWLLSMIYLSRNGIHLEPQQIEASSSRRRWSHLCNMLPPSWKLGRYHT